jgi:signal peptidase II
MNANKIIRTLIILAILATNVGCDQVSKHMVRQSVGEFEQISVIKNFVTLMKVENTGAFLSWGSSLPQPFKLILLSVLPVVVLALAFLFVLTQKDLSKLTVVAICFVLGGGIGNIYDRVMHGSVTDFLHIDFVIFQTGVFNMADVSVMLGMFFVLVEAYLKRRSQPATPETIE